mmetsp:Transcript_47098/g.47935  ORF Transcript_47098/g.47935 Transcript_47098/m.47935 type:complete len:223 (-) Transcript_47098:126-794(-)
MKFTTTFLSLFAAIVVSSMTGEVDARIRVGGDSRDLNSQDNMYTVYFANSCKTDVQVKINLGENNDKQQKISANSCQVFQRGSQIEGPMVTATYTELGIDGATQVVSCQSSNINQCHLMGMANNACVIPLAVCPEPVSTQSPTRSPTQSPTSPPSPGKQCGRRCNNRYECSNENGTIDKGFPYCGAECKHNRCQPFYQECNSDSDCNPNKTVCGEQGFCVGK